MNEKNLLVFSRDNKNKFYVQEVKNINIGKKITGAKELSEYNVNSIINEYEKKGFTVLIIDEVIDNFSIEEAEKLILKEDFSGIQKHCSLIYHYKMGVTQYFSAVYS